MALPSDDVDDIGARQVAESCTTIFPLGDASKDTVVQLINDLNETT